MDQVVLVNRTPITEESLRRCEAIRERGYYLDVEGAQPLQISPTGLLFIDGDSTVAVLETDGPVLLTTAVTPTGLNALVPFLAQAIHKRFERRVNEPLFVIACENLKNNSSILRRMLLSRLHREQYEVDCIRFFNTSCFFLDTVVDRVCLSPELRGGAVHVNVESGSEWVIDQSELIGCQEHLQTLRRLLGDTPRLVSKREYDFLEKRKTWFVNGTQLAIAAYSAHLSYTHLNDALRDVDVRRNIDILLDAFRRALWYAGYIQGLTLPDADAGSIRSYSDSVLQRLLQIADPKSRILRDLLKILFIEPEIRRLLTAGSTVDARSTLLLLDQRAFFEKVLVRLVEPYEDLINYSRLPDATVPQEDFVEATRFFGLVFKLVSDTYRDGFRFVETL
jgi:hypothetical protein